MLGPTQVSSRSRLGPWLVAVGMLTACAHASDSGHSRFADDEELTAALAHPAQRDRALLEQRLEALDTAVAAEGQTAAGREDALIRLAVLRTLAALATERIEALEHAAAESEGAEALDRALLDAAERARQGREALERRRDAALAHLLAERPDDPETAHWLGERLNLCVALGRPEASELAATLLRRFPSSPDVRLARLVLGEAALEAGEPGDALAHLAAVLVPHDVDDELARRALAELPAAYVRSRARDTSSGSAAAEFLLGLGLTADEILDALDAMMATALLEGRDREALDLGITERERAGDSPRGCRASARVLHVRLAREGARAAAEELTSALERYQALRSRERGSEQEIACRSALVGTALAIATTLYQDALGLPETAGLGDRVPPAVRPFDRDRMRRVDALLRSLAAAFPDLRAEETLDTEHPHRDASQLDAARRVVEDAILATDPTPPAPPRRHPPRRRPHRRLHRRPHR